MLGSWQRMSKRQPERTYAPYNPKLAPATTICSAYSISRTIVGYTSVHEQVHTHAFCLAYLYIPTVVKQYATLKQYGHLVYTRLSPYANDFDSIKTPTGTLDAYPWLTGACNIIYNREAKKQRVCYDGISAPFVDKTCVCVWVWQTLYIRHRGRPSSTALTMCPRFHPSSTCKEYRIWWSMISLRARTPDGILLLSCCLHYAEYSVYLYTIAAAAGCCCCCCKCGGQ